MKNINKDIQNMMDESMQFVILNQDYNDTSDVYNVIHLINSSLIRQVAGRINVVENIVFDILNPNRVKICRRLRGND